MPKGYLLLPLFNFSNFIDKFLSHSTVTLGGIHLSSIHLFVYLKNIPRGKKGIYFLLPLSLFRIS